jgi:hypothetical protein
MSLDLYLNHKQFEAAKLVESILSEPACPDLKIRCKELYDCLYDRDSIVVFSSINPLTELLPESLSVYQIMDERYQFCERRLLCYLSNGRLGFVKPRQVLNSILDIEDVVILIMGAVHEIPLPDNYKAMIDKEKIDVTQNNTIKTILSWDDGWTAILKKMVSILRFEKNDVMDDLKTFVECELDKVTCCMCLERERDVVFNSCKMCCVCHICVELIDPKKCPLCRKEFNQYDIIPVRNWKPEVHGEFKYTGSCMQDVCSLLASLKTHA